MSTCDPSALLRREGQPLQELERGPASAFATVRRVLRACGFALVPFDLEAPEVARLVELSRPTPEERLRVATAIQ